MPRLPHLHRNLDRPKVPLSLLRNLCHKLHILWHQHLKLLRTQDIQIFLRHLQLQQFQVFPPFLEISSRNVNIFSAPLPPPSHILDIRNPRIFLLPPPLPRPIFFRFHLIDFRAHFRVSGALPFEAAQRNPLQSPLNLQFLRT